ncbi:hypothetical protein D043_4931A, partial [Vibrio parahaemolyticus EKP-021]
MASDHIKKLSSS